MKNDLLNTTALAGSGGGGGKGGGGTSRAAVESPDSLQSVSYARVVDAISEGEIYGAFLTGLKWIKLDKTPIENADGSYNFSGVVAQWQNGTQAQPYLPGFSFVESEQQVNVEIKAAVPVIRTISDPNANVARLTLMIPALTFQDSSTGDISGSSVQIAIDLQSNGGGYANVLNDTITGKTRSKYFRAYRVTLTGSPPWDIRVRRITADSANSNLQNQTWLASYATIIETKLRYPNTAVIGIQLDARQFNSVPRRSYLLRGLIIKVPTNYDPIARTYSGSWDGTFKLAYSNNPAWCWYDLVTNPRYGLGDYVGIAQVDKWKLYTIGQYCDETVPDGFGGFEPRFTCNIYLQTREEAYKVLNDLASIFRGMIYWGAGSVTATQDAPKDPVAMFSCANVIDGHFSYSGSARSQRHTVALVRWNDPASSYAQRTEYVEDQQGLNLFGYRPTDVIAVGCTSRGQAHRVGLWLLYTERLETDTVSFTAGLDAAYLRPGDIIQIQDQNRAGLRLSGRLVANPSSTSVQIDSRITIDPGKTYTLYCTLPDGTSEAKILTNSAGTADTLTFATAFSATPLINSIWLVSASDLVPQLANVLAVAESDTTNFAVTALFHNPTKFNAVENNLSIEPQQISILTGAATQPPPPTNLNLSEQIYSDGFTARSKISASWQAPAYQFIKGYFVQYKIGDGNRITVDSSQTAPAAEILNVGVNDVTIYVRTVNTGGLLSAPLEGTFSAAGLTSAPAAITGLSLVQLGAMAVLKWNPINEVTVRMGGSIRIRHTSKSIDEAKWVDGVDVKEALSGSDTQEQVPLLAGTYMVKAVSVFGIPSETAALVTAAQPNVPSFVLDQVIQEDSTFTGAKTNVVFSNPVIRLDGSNLSGLYEFANRLTYAEAMRFAIELDINATSYSNTDLIGSRGLVSQWVRVSGADVAGASVAVEFSATTDDPANPAAVYTPWQPFLVNELTARDVIFRERFSVDSLDSNIQTSRLRVNVKMLPRQEQANGVAIASGGQYIAFAKKFRTTAVVAAIMTDGNTGDYVRITGETESGFYIQCFNSSNAGVAKTVNWQAAGYGSTA